MNRIDTCDACGQIDVPCSVDTVLDEHGLTTTVVCEDFDNCFHAWEEM